jgi:hypothetical protein
MVRCEVAVPRSPGPPRPCVALRRDEFARDRVVGALDRDESGDSIGVERVISVRLLRFEVQELGGARFAISSSIRVPTKMIRSPTAHA